jgi:hypothetical protein
MGFEKTTASVDEKVPSNLEKIEVTTTFGPYHVVKFDNSGSEHKFASNDLFISTSVLKETLHLDIDSSEIVPIPIGSTVSKVDFMPNGFAYFDEGNKFAALALGIKGVSNFFYACSDQGLHTDYLYGSTNESMAKAAQIMGFKVLDMPDREDRPKNMKFIYAPIEDVYKAVTNILSEQPEKIQKLLSRYPHVTDWSRTPFAKEREDDFYKKWIFQSPTELSTQPAN